MRVASFYRAWWGDVHDEYPATDVFLAYLDWWDLDRRERLIAEHDETRRAARIAYAMHKPSLLRDEATELATRLARPAPWDETARQAAGFTDSERAGLRRLLESFRPAQPAMVS